MAETGHGKSHSIQYLDPKKTVIIDADKQGLPFRGWKKQYSKEKKNYFATSNPDSIEKVLKGVSSSPEYSHISCIVIDTLNAVMIDDEMKRSKEKSFDKWVDLAYSVYNIVSLAKTLREDLTVFCLFHVQDIADDLGNHFYRIQTSGQKLQKIKLETKFNIVLFGKCEYGEENRYYFDTQAKYSTAKSPLGMFPTREIPNNLKIVMDSIKAYEGSNKTEEEEQSTNEKEN